MSEAARGSPVTMALYSSTICRKMGGAIIPLPRRCVPSVCPVVPNRNIFARNRSGSSGVGFPRACGGEPLGERPQARHADDRRAATASPRSCHARMPGTTPPIARTERTARRVDVAGAVYGTSRTSPVR